MLTHSRQLDETQCAAFREYTAMQALPLANYLIRVSICRKSWISNLQLQKILYFLQIRSLIENDCRHPLIADEFEAWRFAPELYEV